MFMLHEPGVQASGRLLPPSPYDSEEAGMNGEDAGQGISRRKVLTTAGLAAVAVPLAAAGPAKAAALVRQADIAGAPGPDGVHVQYGADAATQAAVSWQTAARVSRPRL